VASLRLSGVDWDPVTRPNTPPAFVPSPLCVYQPVCRVPGQAVIGPWVRVGDSDNREFQCWTCGRRGVESRVICVRT